MRVFKVASKTAFIIACGILLSACSATQVKEGGKQLGTSALGQLMILTVFGADALEEHNEKEYREWYWKTTPYRSSFTRDNFSELQDRMEFEHFYQELQARESKDSQDNKR